MGARGSDAALEQAEVILMNDRIENFLSALPAEPAGQGVIRQNLGHLARRRCGHGRRHAFGAVPLVVGVVAHEGSTLVVCLNSLRLLWQARLRPRG